MSTNLKDEKLHNKQDCTHSYVRNLIEASLDPLVTISKEGKITEVNEATIQTTGISREELVGTDFSNYFTEPEKAREGYKKVFSEGFIKDFPLAIRHVSGKITYVLYNATLYKNSSNTIQGVFAAARDITERKQALDALRESEEKFRYLFEHSSAGKSITYPSGETHVNNSFCKILGYSKEELENRRWEDITYPDDIELSQKAINPIISREQDSARFEKRYVHKNGSIVWADVSTSLRRDEEGKPIYFMTTILDITEKKKKEEIIRFQSDQYTTMLNTTPDGFWIFDKNGKLLDVNNTYCLMTGYSRDELLHLRIPNDLDAIETPDITLQRIQSVITKGFCRFETKHRKKDGKLIDVEISASYWRSEENILVFIRNITERKKSEADLHKINDELIRSNKEFEQFAYIVSHDLQEPLRTIYTFAEFLDSDYKGKLDIKADEYIEFITSASRRMRQMINDILALSRVGTREKGFLLIDVERIIKIVIENLRGFINQHNAIVTYDTPMPTILADETQLIQLLQNLIDNGIKFHKKDEYPKIHISFKRVYNEWIFSVKDNGIGIEEKYFKKLFVIFSRLHSREKYPGTGIGLAMCKKIIERHGGRIWLESKVGEGSTFYFTIPIQQKQ
jgi:PAS domain S-box-containing protein